MAYTEKQYCDYSNLTLYDQLIKAYISTLSNLAIKTILFSNDGNSVYFYKKANASSSDTPDYTFSLNSSALADRVTTLENKGTYAGGTNVTLNGINKSNSTASFYAPEGAGTTGQVLVSNGSGAPRWDWAEIITLTPSLSGDALIFIRESGGSSLTPSFSGNALIFS